MSTRRVRIGIAAALTPTVAGLIWGLIDAGIRRIGEAIDAASGDRQ